MKWTVSFLAVLVACLGLTEVVGDENEDLRVYSPAKIKWMDGPPSIPAGCKLALLEGDPGKEGRS